MEGSAKPFLKWAGGKRWLAQSKPFSTLLRTGKYIEPFLGSAAMFFALRPTHSILSDANLDLIDLYEVVRDDHERLIENLAQHQSLHGSAHYYRVRAARPTDKAERAARTLYLNRTCWNGLYRVNLKGEFNVPIGTKDRVLMDDNFQLISEALRNATIKCCDFADSISHATQGDLVYADPPYTVRHNMNGFLKYNENIFSWEDQVRLRDHAVSASLRGATVIVSNADHQSLHELYHGVAECITVQRASVLSGDAKARGSVTETIFVLTQEPMAVLPELAVLDSLRALEPATASLHH